MNNDLLPLISIPVLYIFIAFVKPYIQPKLPFNTCAICAAVSASWLILIIMWFAGYELTVLPLAILMGMSISGIMYKLEDLYKKKHIRNFWFVRLVIITGGFFTIYLLLNKNWDLLLFVAIVEFFAIIIPTLLFQKTTREDHDKKSSLIKRLDDCC